MVFWLAALQKSTSFFAGTNVPVGLLGLQRKTSFVLVEIRFSISSKSYPLSAPTGTQLTVAPHCLA